MTDDAELLRQYAQAGSEDAFAELVQRYLPVVFASALRQTRGDTELAKDVCQTVFIDLGRKVAESTLRISPHYFNTTAELERCRGALVDLISET